jgi:hypothetical protein
MEFENLSESQVRDAITRLEDEGDNLAIEYRFAEGKAERLSDLVAELLKLQPDVLVVAGTPAVKAGARSNYQHSHNHADDE